MRYEDVPAGPEEEALELTRAGDPRPVAILSLAFDSSDGVVAENRALELLSHRDSEVRRAAVRSLGHIARIHGRLDVGRATSRLPEIAATEPALAGVVDDALDDIAMFVRR
ncbi:hypothetical protein [Stackebrandtia soli]|uniref:hypothetical protein n=1 Tax=Stackebrandtia soli TaxID=1892856 RepID=UPI0039EC218F